jgi:hypothetical protein
MSFTLGVDESTGLIFEGRTQYGAHLVWPTPQLTNAQFLDASAKEFPVNLPGRESTYYFREDFFEPVSRIRRGRFYKYGNSTGDRWMVLPSPHVSIPRFGSADDNGMLDVPSLAKYLPCSLFAELEQLGLANSVVALGRNKSSTIWSIVNVETIFTGEELVTLKARQSFGALPELDLKKLPAQNENGIREALQTLEDDYHLASPESVVDRANEAATRILNAYLELKGRNSQDSLFKAIKEVGGLDQQDKKEIVKNSADVVRLLHGRTKYAVQRDKNTRDVREQDAELAVQCIGVMLCDLCWAAWR